MFSLFLSEVFQYFFRIDQRYHIFFLQINLNCYSFSVKFYYLKKQFFFFWRYLWSDTLKSVIMELLAACEHRDATGINFCYTPKRQVTLLYTFYEVIEYQEQYIINLHSFHFIGNY